MFFELSPASVLILPLLYITFRSFKEVFSKNIEFGLDEFRSREKIEKVKAFKRTKTNYSFDKRLKKWQKMHFNSRARMTNLLEKKVTPYEDE
jgi:hypothetical protein